MLRLIRIPIMQFVHAMNIPLMFSGGFFILLSVLTLILYDESVDRIKRFFRTLDQLLRIRKSITPRVKVTRVDKVQCDDLKKVFDV